MLADTPGDLVIVNLQKTEMDERCKIRIFSNIDDVFQKLMDHFDLEIPQFELQRFIQIKFRDDEELSITGLTDSGSTSDLFSDVKIIKEGEDFSVTLQFHGHYNEPDLHFAISRHQIPLRFGLKFNPEVQNV